MKITVKMPFYDRNGLHKKGELVEIETAAFNPFTMAQVETSAKKAPVAVPEAVEAEAETIADKAEKKPRKRRTRKE